MKPVVERQILLNKFSVGLAALFKEGSTVGGLLAGVA
tara:strand:+ start:33 stop:143 length:111 start_codon:yes stop_codon:yes gene_type:complete